MKKILIIGTVVGFFGCGTLLILYKNNPWATICAVILMLIGGVCFGLWSNPGNSEPKVEAIVEFGDKKIIFDEPTVDQLEFIKDASQMLSTEKYNTLLGIGKDGGNNIVKGELSTIMKLQDILFEKEKMYFDSQVRAIAQAAYDQGRNDKEESIKTQTYVYNLENIFDDHLKNIN